jgi:50S ribosomal subunit-associated GTPase HflX
MTQVELLDAFRSTLDEVAGTDPVLHVVDASVPDAPGRDHDGARDPA